MSSYDDLVARACADAGVVGLILSGSQARGMGGPHSDHDVFVVVPERDGRWVTSRSPSAENSAAVPANPPFSVTT